MRVAVVKIGSVRDGKVSLNEGLATIEFAPSNRISIEQVRTAICLNGFISRGADVRVARAPVARSDTLLRTVPESGDSFVLRGAAGTAGNLSAGRNGKSSKHVQVEGKIPDSRKGVAGGLPSALFARSFKAE